MSGWNVVGAGLAVSAVLGGAAGGIMGRKDASMVDSYPAGALWTASLVAPAVTSAAVPQTARTGAGAAVFAAGLLLSQGATVGGFMGARALTGG